MNVFGQLDKGMVVGYLKESGSVDPDVIRGRYMHLRSQIELYRKLLLIPFILGCIQIGVGIIGLIIIVGFVLLIPGGLFAGVSWWLRSRLAKNLEAATAAYQEYAGQLGMPPAA